MKTITLIMLCLTISGCAVMSATYEHPVTRQTQKCESWGWGWLGTPIAVVTYVECKRKLEKAGWLMIPDDQAPTETVAGK